MRAPPAAGVRFVHVLYANTAVAYDIARGSVATYNPEANALLPHTYHDEHSGTPSYKSVPDRISLSRRELIKWLRPRNAPDACAKGVPSFQPGGNLASIVSPLGN